MSESDIDLLFENRQTVDYVELSGFEIDQVKLMLSKATRFVREMENLLNSKNG